MAALAESETRADTNSEWKCSAGLVGQFLGLIPAILSPSTCLFLQQRYCDACDAMGEKQRCKERRRQANSSFPHQSFARIWPVFGLSIARAWYSLKGKKAQARRPEVPVPVRYSGPFGRVCLSSIKDLIDVCEAARTNEIQ